MEKDIRSQEIGAAWYAALGGAAAILVAAIIQLVAPNLKPSGQAVQMLLVFIGAVAIGAANMIRPGHVRLLILASAACVLALFAIPDSFDSFRLVAGFGALVSASGAVLVALPINYRKIVVSVLVLLHFGGILCAVTAPERQPWLSNVVGISFYRPYLDFMYLTNAYHFYSPEPGPASQVWFCIKYKANADGVASVRWYKMPQRPKDMTDPLALSYYRRLSLTQQLENVIPGMITDDMKRARLMKAQGKDGIPIDTYAPFEAQYRLPADSVREHILPSYVRHVASMPENQHDDGVTLIESIKVYRVEHAIPSPSDLKIGVKFYDETTYRPFYLGEFDPKGTLLNPTDPLLYWLVPILWEAKDPKHTPPWHTPRTNPEEFRIVDGVKLHTGSDHNLTNERAGQ